MMKKVSVIAVLCAASLPAVAGTCYPAKEYAVSNIAFARMPLNLAVSKILGSTPLVAKVNSAVASTEVSAEGVSGDMEGVLTELARSVDATWVQDGCNIVFGRPKAASNSLAQVAEKTSVVELAPVAASWVLLPDIPVHIQVGEWAVRAGWSFEWKVDTSWVVPARAEFGGSYISALTEVVNTLYSEGRPVRLEAWEANKVSEVISNDVK